MDENTYLRSMSNSDDISAWTTTGAPRSPLSMILSMARAIGRKRVHMASIRKTRWVRARATRERNSSALVVAGFSTRTCFPALIASAAFG